MQVLIVDDDPIFRSLLRSKLSVMTHNIIEAEDGLLAWPHLRTGTFDLAIIDLEMPNIDGFQLLKCIRGYERTRHMPVVVATSRDDVQAIRNALESGASSYLSKPVNWSLFNDHIAHLVRMSEATTALERKLEAVEADAAANEAAVLEMARDADESNRRIAKAAQMAMRALSQHSADPRAAEDATAAVNSILLDAGRTNAALSKLAANYRALPAEAPVTDGAIGAAMTRLAS